MNVERSYYDILGVESGAPKEEIRAAYQERLADAQGELEAAQSAKRPSEDDIGMARRETARVREAWQVLSDPVQRERYDERLGVTSGAGAGAGADSSNGEVEVVDQEPATAGAGRGQRARPPRDPSRPGLFSNEPEAAPASWPAGFHPPPPRARLLAMMIDIVVIYVFVVVAQTAGNAAVSAIEPEKTDKIEAIDDRVDRLEDQRDGAEEEKDRADERVNRAERQGDEAARQAAIDDRRAANQDVERLENQIDDAEEQRDELQNDLLPAQLGLFAVTFVVAMLYLVPSSVITGRTFGKRMFWIRVVNADGSKLGWRGAFLRYGVPVGLAVLFSPILGPLIFVVVLFGVVTWPRNPNRQGLQDRLAGTIVVDG